MGLATQESGIAYVHIIAHYETKAGILEVPGYLHFSIPAAFKRW